jgi:hypothetical protein
MSASSVSVVAATHGGEIAGPLHRGAEAHQLGGQRDLV